MKNLILQSLMTVLALTIFVAVSCAQEKTIEAKIYLLNTFESPDLLTTLELLPAARKVKAKFPLRSTLEALTTGATAEETAQNLRTPFNGVDFLSVRVENKTAFAYFT